MTDEDKTDPNWRSYYASAEARADRLLEPIKASPWTAAILAASHVAAFVAGWWAGR